MKEKLALLIIMTLLLAGCGRTPSRYLGKDHRQILEVSHLKQFRSISFYNDGGSTIKDVTYVADDDYTYTQEFKDVSPLKGVIRWVPASEEESFIRTRAISRWFGNPVNLRLPDDCKQIMGVNVSSASGSTRVKNMTYISNDGHIYSKEYRDGVVARHLEGWLEVKKKE